MTEGRSLTALLDQARVADPMDRIELRDPIAAYGVAAIPPMREWLEDELLGRFAIRVIGRIAEQPDARISVLAALQDTDPTRLLPDVASDVSDLAARLAGRRSTTRTQPRASGSTEEWPGSRAVSPLELQFHDDMLGIFRLAGEATRRVRADGSIARGYWASYFLRGVRNHGGPAYARQLLRAEGTSDGFRRLTEEHKLELTVEALVLRPEYASLFTDDERAVASDRLARAGYNPAQAQSGIRGPG